MWLLALLPCVKTWFVSSSRWVTAQVVGGSQVCKDGFLGHLVVRWGHLWGSAEAGTGPGHLHACRGAEGYVDTQAEQGIVREPGLGAGVQRESR